MLHLNLAAITQVMRRAVERMQKEGLVQSRERIILLRDVFPFKPQDVESISYPQESAGAIRFCLRNGGIFDEYGKPAKAEAGAE